MNSRVSSKRPAKLVVDAIRELKTGRGFTPKEIIRYISTNYGITTQMIKCVLTALKRGAEYGILQSNRGCYALKVSPTVPAVDQSKKNNTAGNPSDLEVQNARKSLCKPRKSRRRRSRRSRSRRGKGCGCRRGSKRRRRRSRKSSCGSRRRRSHRSRRRKSRSRRRSLCKSRKSRRRHRSKRRSGGRRKCGSKGSRRRHRSRRSRRRRAKCRC